VQQHTHLEKAAQTTPALAPDRRHNYEWKRSMYMLCWLTISVSSKSHWKNDCNHEALNCWRGARPCYPYQSKRPRRASTIKNRSSRHSRFLLRAAVDTADHISNYSNNNEPRSSERAHPEYSAALPLKLVSQIDITLILPSGEGSAELDR
jgi:hypothetical protein